MNRSANSTVGMDTRRPTAPQFVSWTQEHSGKYGVEPICAKHTLHELALFSDASIIDLLDTYPRDCLQVFTMGTDPENRSEWQPVDTRDASGKDIMHAVSVGKLWVKLMRIDLVASEYEGLVRDVYRDIGDQYAEFHALWLRPLLLISSPGALVYYHTDPQNMMLWQIKGTKRVWVYPPRQPFVQPQMMEEIFSGDADEEIPYDSVFDDLAEVFDLRSGEVLSWPLNAPHRVTNHDSVNISLSVTVGTDDADRRSQLFQANMLLRIYLGLRNPSVSESGLRSFCKRTGFRVARKLGLTPGLAANREPYLARLRIDGNSPSGVSPVPDGPVQTLF
jgi:hypothetical protein